MSGIKEGSVSCDPTAVQYGIEEQFFALWLDRELLSSCAMFEGGDSLETAQLRKLDYHIAQSRAAGRRRVSRCRLRLGSDVAATCIVGR